MHYIKMFLKELKTAATDRDIVVVLLLAPIFMTLLIGGVYLHIYVEGIPMAVFDADNSSLSRQITRQFMESERFEVRYICNSEVELKEVMEKKRLSMGLYIPSHFAMDVGEGKAPQVLLLMDGANLILSNNSYAAAAGIIQSAAAEVSIRRMEAKGVIPETARKIGWVFSFNDRILYDPRMTYLNYMMLGFIALFFQQVIISGVGVSAVKLLDEFSGMKLFKKMLNRFSACLVLALFSTAVSILIAGGWFKIPIQGNLAAGLLMCMIFAVAVSCPAFILAVLLRDKIKLVQICYMLSLPTFISCGYVWPREQMPEYLVWIIKLFWPLIYFARPFDELLLKGVPVREMIPDFLQMLVYILIWFLAAVMVYRVYEKKRQQLPVNA